MTTSRLEDLEGISPRTCSLSATGRVHVPVPIERIAFRSPSWRQPAATGKGWLASGIARAPVGQPDRPNPPWCVPDSAAEMPRLSGRGCRHSHGPEPVVFDGQSIEDSAGPGGCMLLGGSDSQTRTSRTSHESDSRISIARASVGCSREILRLRHDEGFAHSRHFV